MCIALRLILLCFLAFNLIAPSVASAKITTSVSSDPCPSKPQLNQCILEDAIGMAAPRGGKAFHLPCLEKAVGAQPIGVSPPRNSRALAFRIRSMHRIGWIPHTMDPPPRLLTV